jgi:hypothetical protein
MEWIADGSDWIMIVSGLLTFSIGFLMMRHVDVNTGFVLMAALSALTRIGLSWVLTPLNATALRNVPPEKLANASSNANFFRQLGGGMGIAILVAVLETRTTFHASSLTATQTPANVTSAETIDLLAGLLAETGIPEALRQATAIDFLGRIVYENASIFGFQDAFLTLAVITLIAAVPAWFVRQPAATEMPGVAPAPVPASDPTPLAALTPPAPLSQQPPEPTPAAGTPALAPTDSVRPRLHRRFARRRALAGLRTWPAGRRHP